MRGRCGQHGPIVGVYSEGSNRPGSFRQAQRTWGLVFSPLSPWERAGVRVRTTAGNQPRKFGSRHSLPDKMGQGDSGFQSPPTSRPTRLRPSGFNPRPPIKAGAPPCSPVASRGLRGVSILARLYRRALRSDGEPAEVSAKFQSSPAYIGGRSAALLAVGLIVALFQSSPAYIGGRSRDWSRSLSGP